MVPPTTFPFAKADNSGNETMDLYVFCVYLYFYIIVLYIYI